MRLIMKENRELTEPEVTIEYNELSGSVKRVSDYVKSVDATITCKKETKNTPFPPVRSIIWKA